MCAAIDQDFVLRRKKIIFRFAIVLMFFTSMSKVLVPGAVFDPMQLELGLDATTLAELSSWYMLAYAGSQFIFGILADRLGGTRILLVGGCAFCLGMLAFPMCSTPWVMKVLRTLTGFGAGIVFIGLARLIADLYIQRFTYILSFSLVIGYLGPVTGMGPMVWLVKAMGWRQALLLPAIVSAVNFLGIALFARHTFTPLGERRPVWKPLAAVMGKLDMARLCVSSAIAFGCHYALLNVMGRKCLEDSATQGAAWPSVFMTGLALCVVVLNLLGGPLSKLAENRRGPALNIIMALSLSGSFLGWLTLKCGWGTLPLAATYLCIAIPAGLFPVYCDMAKKGLPQQYTALAVSLVNFWAFVFIALVGTLAGAAMSRNEHLAHLEGDALVYPPEAYQGVFAVFIALAAVAFILTLGLYRRSDKPAQAA